jgi:chemotaxis-related protein WspB
MLVVQFSVDAKRYAIGVDDVRAVLPVPPLRELDLAPPWVAGLLPLMGGLVPVIDLCALHRGQPCRRAYSTRIILVRYLDQGDRERSLGLIAEEVTDVADVESGSLQPSGIAQPEAPWLGGLGTDVSGGVIQVVSVAALLTEEVRARLFKDEP